MGEFLVSKNYYRAGARDNYIVTINPEDKKRKKIGSYAVLTIDKPELKKRRGKVKREQLRVWARVLVNEDVDSGELCVDQTLRIALGIKVGFDTNEEERQKIKIDIYPLKRAFFQKIGNFLSFLLGKRYVYLRMCKMDIPDLEKNICKIPLDVFNVIGCEPGDKVSFKTLIKKDNYFKIKHYRLKAFEASNDYIKKREELEGDLNSRYYSSKEILKIEQDIHRIFFDADIMEKFDIGFLDPVCIRRSIVDQFFKHFREFGILFFLSLVANFLILPIQMTWLSLLVITIISLVFSLLIIMINIRAMVK